MSDEARPVASREGLDRIEGQVDTILADMAQGHGAIVGVERGEPSERRWFVRMNGDEKATFSIWFRLDQRNLHADTYFMPFPAANEADTFAYLLRKAGAFPSIGLKIGDEDGVYWHTAVPHHWISREGLDELIGALFVATEDCFRSAMRLGFPDRFNG